MTRLRFSQSADADVLDLPNPQSKRRRPRRRDWRDGAADQTVVQPVEDFRSYRALERALVHGFDPRSAIELLLAHRLASLLWRLRRAGAIETGLFQIQWEAGTTPPVGQTPMHVCDGEHPRPDLDGRRDWSLAEKRGRSSLECQSLGTQRVHLQ